MPTTTDAYADEAHRRAGAPDRGAVVAHAHLEDRAGYPPVQRGLEADVAAADTTIGLADALALARARLEYLADRLGRLEGKLQPVLGDAGPEAARSPEPLPGCELAADTIGLADRIGAAANALDRLADRVAL